MRQQNNISYLGLMKKLEMSSMTDKPWKDSRTGSAYRAAVTNEADTNACNKESQLVQLNERQQCVCLSKAYWEDNKD